MIAISCYFSSMFLLWNISLTFSYNKFKYSFHRTVMSIYINISSSLNVLKSHYYYYYSVFFLNYWNWDVSIINSTIMCYAKKDPQVKFFPFLMPLKLHYFHELAACACWHIFPFLSWFAISFSFSFLFLQTLSGGKSEKYRAKNSFATYVLQHILLSSPSMLWRGFRLKLYSMSQWWWWWSDQLFFSYRLTIRQISCAIRL